MATSSQPNFAGERLRFGADGRLCADGRVLAFVAAGERADVLGRLVANDVEHTIVAPSKSAAWRFDLLDDDGRRTGGFRPFRLRRGGRLRSGELSIVLQGHSWSNDRWSFATPDGSRVEATVEGPGGSRAAGTGDVEITLEADAAAGLVPLSAQALVLAFGCWLIAQWHTIAPGDHMLTSTGAGGELAGSLGSPVRGGIARPDAN
jgi:hypothetical protein